MRHTLRHKTSEKVCCVASGAELPDSRADAQSEGSWEMSGNRVTLKPFRENHKDSRRKLKKIYREAIYPCIQLNSLVHFGEPWTPILFKFHYLDHKS